MIHLPHATRPNASQPSPAKIAPAATSCCLRAARVRFVYAHLDQLPLDAQGALVSLIYNRGTSMGKPGFQSWAQRREMRAIQADLADGVQRGDLADTAAQLRSMKRLWEGKGFDGLSARREAEARLVERAGAEKVRALALLVCWGSVGFVDAQTNLGGGEGRNRTDLARTRRDDCSFEDHEGHQAPFTLPLLPHSIHRSVRVRSFSACGCGGGVPGAY